MIKLKQILNEKKNIRESSDMPPGMSNVKFEPVETLFNEEQELDEANLPTDVMYSVVKNPSKFWKRQKQSKVWDKSKEEPYIHNTNKKGDIEDLIDAITEKPKKLLDQNAKIKKSGGKEYKFYNFSLPAFRGLFYDEDDGQIKILNTCPMAGECRKFCYAQKGGYVQFNKVQLSHTRKLNFLFNHWDEFKSKMISEIESADAQNQKKGIQTVIRWHDSGDFLAPSYLRLAYEIAKSTPDVLHYAYTKSVNMQLESEAPDNFVFNFSFGGLQDTDIDVSKHKHANVVQKDLFDEYITKYKDEKGNSKYKFNSDSDRKSFERKMANEFGIDKNSIITYDELMDMPYDKSDEPKWNVIVGPGDGDDAALRKDVMGTYLLLH